MTDIIVSDRWQLYSAHPRFAEATAALDAALIEAMRLPTWEAARKHMRKVQDRFQDVGAHDSEPRNVIVDLLNTLFPDGARDYYSMGAG